MFSYEEVFLKLNVKNFNKNRYFMCQMVTNAQKNDIFH